jgi:uncharacterized surface protein with fasciclin (FAS1) repeats
MQVFHSSHAAFFILLLLGSCCVAVAEDNLFPSDQPSVFEFDASDSPSVVASNLPSDVPSDAPSTIPDSLQRTGASDVPSGVPSPYIIESDAPTVGAATIASILSARQAEWSFFHNGTIITGLLESLDNRHQGSDFVTLVVSSDKSWDVLPDAFKDALTSNPAFRPHFKILLAYHVAQGAFKTTDISNNTFAPSVIGEDLFVQTTANSSVILVNGLPTVESNIEASNGIIHVVDDGILAPAWLFQSIGSWIESLTSFSTFFQWMTFAGLPLTNPGEITVLAPSNQAIVNSFSNTTISFLSTSGNENTTLALLAYHVVQGVFVTSAFENNTDYITLLEGSPLRVTLSSDTDTTQSIHFDNTVGLDSDAMVLNLLANNGVMHGIDGVLIPSGLNLPE